MLRSWSQFFDRSEPRAGAAFFKAASAGSKVRSQSRLESPFFVWSRSRPHLAGAGVVSGTLDVRSQSPPKTLAAQQHWFASKILKIAIFLETCFLPYYHLRHEGGRDEWRQLRRAHRDSQQQRRGGRRGEWRGGGRGRQFKWGISYSLKVRILKLYGTDLVRYPDLDLALFCIFVILNMFTSFLYSDKLLIIFYSHWNIVHNL